MARISLLFSLALVLAIGSVSAHLASNMKKQKTLCPATLSQLQTYPFIEISKIVKKQAAAQETTQFSTLFSICKGYSEFLGNFQKIIGSKDVFGKVHAKYVMMTKAMLEAQAAIGVEGQLAGNLKKCYTDMALGFIELPEKISKISAKYHFKGDAKLSLSDRIEIDTCLTKLKGSIGSFVKVITQISKKYSAENEVDFTITPGFGGFIGAYVKKGLGFGGQSQLNAGVKAGAHSKGKSKGRAGGKVGGNIGGLFLGLGGKVQFDAAGKATVGGGSEFRTLSHPRSKHLD